MDQRVVRSRPGAVATLAATLLVLASAADARAQQGAIVGQVTDAATAQPLDAVQIFVPGTSLGVLSDEGGRFRLQVPAGEVQVRAQRIGYRTVTRTVTVTADQVANVQIEMQATAISMDELVVTGTAGAQTKRELGNVVSSIDAEEQLEKAPIHEVGELLKGRAPGVTVSPSTGQIGSGPNVRIRGVSTFSLFDHPLVYVDGIRVDNATGRGISIQGFGSGVMTALNDLDPDQIESIEIIKGPAAATLYGTEASNGVVQIITKKGRPGSGPRLTISAEGGANWFRNAAGRIDPNWGIHPGTGEPYVLDLFAREDSLGNDIFSTGYRQAYNLSLRGGSDVFQYYLSGGFEDAEGIEPTNELQRFNARTNFGIDPHPDWTIDASVGLTQADRRLSCEAGCGGVWFSLLFSSPSTVLTPNRGFLFGPPEFQWNWRDFPQSTDKLTYSVNTQWQPTDFMTHRLIVGQDFVDDVFEQVVERIVDPFLLQFVTDETARGSKFIQKRHALTTSVDYSGSLTLDLNETLRSEFSLGAQYYRRLFEFVTVDARGFPAPGITVTAAAAQVDGASDDFIENNTLGVFAQEQLVLNDRLYLTAAVRVDDNSAFGDEFDLVAYPKGSLSWVLSEEPWWEIGLFDQFRFRAAYGQAGQQPEAFAALRTFQPVTSGLGETALTPQSVGNPDLAPERGTEIEVGFEAGLLDNRLGVDFTYYNTRTKDAILSKDVPPSAGFPGSQFVNAGEIASQGIELGVNALAIQSNDLSVQLNLNLSTVDNEVIDLGGVDQGQGFISSGSIRFVPGFPVASWFDEIPVSAELDADGQAINVMCDAGDPNGPTLPDGTPLVAGGTAVPCAEAPVLFLGESVPQLEGSLSTTITLFQSLRLYALFDWQTGWTKFDNNVRARCQVFRLCEENFFPERFDPVRVAEIQSPNTIRTFVFNDAGFGKLRTISATYDLPASLLRRLGLGIEAASISLAGQELFAPITNWTGLDPEAEFQEFGFGRLEQNNTPPLAQVTATLRLTF